MHGHGGSNYVCHAPGHTHHPNAPGTHPHSHGHHTTQAQGHGHHSHSHVRHGHTQEAHGHAPYHPRTSLHGRPGDHVHGRGLGHGHGHGLHLHPPGHGHAHAHGHDHKHPFLRRSITKTQIVHQPASVASSRTGRTGIPTTTPHDSRMGVRGDWDRPEVNKMKKRQAEKQQKLEELRNLHQIGSHLAAKTHFSIEQVQALMKNHKRLTSQGQLDRMRFRETMYSTLGVTDDIILDRMYTLFDGDTQGSVIESVWILGLNAILRGTLEEQIAYAYEVYDLNGDRGIARDELYHFLKNSISPIPGRGMQGIDPDEVAECVHDLVEMALRKLDVDGNGVITYGDFYIAVQHDPLLLEALGQCFPQDKDMKAFLAIFSNDYNNFSAHYSHPNDIGWDRDRDKFNRNKEIAAKLKREQKTIKGASPPLLIFRERKETQAPTARRTISGGITVAGGGRTALPVPKALTAFRKLLPH